MTRKKFTAMYRDGVGDENGGKAYSVTLTFPSNTSDGFKDAGEKAIVEASKFRSKAMRGKVMEVLPQECLDALEKDKVAFKALCEELGEKGIHRGACGRNHR